MTHIAYAPDLVEEAVLLAERAAPREEARAFRRERDRLYELSDQDLREKRFRALHRRWFDAFGLNGAVDEGIRSRPDVIDAVSGCRVLRALTRRDEGADLVDTLPEQAGGATPRPILAVRLCATTLLEVGAVRALLAHELMHVGDMLDPAFGYERTLPPSGDGPSGDNILRERYRVLWDVTIDGRLAHAGQTGDRARAARRREFAATFTMLGPAVERAFDEWFGRLQPTHAAIVAFAAMPRGAAAGVDTGRCPLCGFPVASLDARPERLHAGARAIVHANHPAWTFEQGLCTQCLDLYEARHAETFSAGHR